MVENSDANRIKAIKLIDQFDCNLGGTLMFRPFKCAFDTPVDKQFKMRVFCLTDGRCDDAAETLQLIQDHLSKNITCQVFTIGISSDCDQQFVKDAARYG